MPGRKTDVERCRVVAPASFLWPVTRQLPTLTPRFATLRAYLRQRSGWLEYARRPYPAYAEGADGDELAAPSCRVSDITGATGGAGLSEPLLPGERNPRRVGSLPGRAMPRFVRRDGRARRSHRGQQRSGTLHVFALTQSLELYDVYQAKMLDCDPQARKS